MPVKLLRPWQDSSVLILTQKLAERILRRTCPMIESIIVVMGIIALTATVAIARLALHEEIQIAEILETGIRMT